jgi:type II secretory pathway component GspD/PulD (secretin)
VTSFWLCLSVALLALLLGCGADTGGEMLTRGVDGPKVVAISLIRADAEYAAARLKTLLGPGAEVTAYTETNTIFLRADAKDVERARGLLARLDEPRYNYLARLQNADPVLVTRVARAVLAVLAFLGNDSEVRLVPLERNRMILFTATDGQAKCLLWVIRWLDRRW